jgi:CRP-like cAMP-binding protein
VARGIQQFLSKLLRHTPLKHDEQKAILDLSGTLTSVARREEIVLRGEVVDDCCIVIEGMVARLGLTQEGGRQIEAFYVPGDMPDIYALLIPNAAATLETVIESTLFRVPKYEIRDLISRYPRIGEALWRETVIDAGIAHEWILNIGRRDAKARVAHLICEIAARVVDRPNGHFDLYFPVTQEQLAEATGISNVHVNRTLQMLRNEGLLQVGHRRRLQIEDWDGLQMAAGFDPSYLAIPALQRLTPEFAPQSAAPTISGF